MNSAWTRVLFAGVFAVALVLSGCSSSSDDDEKKDEEEEVDPIPEYELLYEDVEGCAEIDTEADTIRAELGCSVIIKFTEAAETDIVRMTVEGEFLASRISAMLFNSGTGFLGNSYWLRFNRSGAELSSEVCIQDDSCSANVPLGTFTGTYNLGDTFTVMAEADKSASPVAFKVWADTDPDATPAGDLSADDTEASTPAGDGLGLEFEGAFITGVSFESL